MLISTIILSLVLLAPTTVTSPGIVSIQCDPSGYNLNLQTGAHTQSVQFFTYVFDDSTLVTGATVTFAMTYPDSTVVVKNARTDSTGRAKATFRLDQAGDYTLNKSVTVGAQTAACTETFSVTLQP